MISRGVRIPVIDEAIEWVCQPDLNPEAMVKKMIWLQGLFPKAGEIPIIKGSSSHPYFEIRMAKIPFQITTSQHPMYTKCTFPELRPFPVPGPELVFEMALPYSVQVCWPKYTQEGIDKKIFLSEEDSRWRHNAHFVILMSPVFSESITFFIAGEELCRKQLEHWGILQGEKFQYFFV